MSPTYERLTEDELATLKAFDADETIAFAVRRPETTARILLRAIVTVDEERARAAWLARELERALARAAS